MREIRPLQGREDGKGVFHVPRHHLSRLRHRRQVHSLVPLEQGADVEGDLVLLVGREGLESRGGGKGGAGGGSGWGFAVPFGGKCGGFC